MTDLSRYPGEKCLRIVACTLEDTSTFEKSLNAFALATEENSSKVSRAHGLPPFGFILRKWGQGRTSLFSAAQV